MITACGHQIVGQLVRQLLGVDHDHDAIEAEPGRAAPGGDADRFGHPTQLQHHVFRWRWSCPQPIEGGPHPITEAAADTAVGELDGVGAPASDQGGIHVDCANVVDQHGDGTGRAGQQFVDKRGLPRTEVAPDQGKGDPASVPGKEVRLLVGHRRPQSRSRGRAKLISCPSGSWM